VQLGAGQAAALPQQQTLTPAGPGVQPPAPARRQDPTRTLGAASTRPTNPQSICAPKLGRYRPPSLHHPQPAAISQAEADTAERNRAFAKAKKCFQQQRQLRPRRPALLEPPAPARRQVQHRPGRPALRETPALPLHPPQLQPGRRALLVPTAPDPGQPQHQPGRPAPVGPPAYGLHLPQDQPGHLAPVVTPAHPPHLPAHLLGRPAPPWLPGLDPQARAPPQVQHWPGRPDTHPAPAADPLHAALQLLLSLPTPLLNSLQMTSSRML
jgi:hypothetical protein